MRLFWGTAIPITRDGGLSTCRHVVDVDITKNEAVGVFDDELSRPVPVSEFKVPTDSKFAIVFISNALPSEKSEFFPLLILGLIAIGENVCSFGNIVNFLSSESTTGSGLICLVYAVIAGLPGSPELLFHYGPELVGMCCGNSQSRVVAAEVRDEFWYRDLICSYHP